MITLDMRKNTMNRLCSHCKVHHGNGYICEFYSEERIALITERIATVLGVNFQYDLNAIEEVDDIPYSWSDSRPGIAYRTPRFRPTGSGGITW